MCKLRRDVDKTNDNVASTQEALSADRPKLEVEHSVFGYRWSAVMRIDCLRQI
ncbi:hypothetical protein J6590_000271 [Homalodisca vitripennis]|nr:hypothetical protein J6590_000271 [Homalodisca vitripennis]